MGLDLKKDQDLINFALQFSKSYAGKVCCETLKCMLMEIKTIERFTCHIDTVPVSDRMGSMQPFE